MLQASVAVGLSLSHAHTAHITLTIAWSLKAWQKVAELCPAMPVPKDPGNLSRRAGLHIAFAASIALAQISCSCD